MSYAAHHFMFICFLNLRRNEVSLPIFLEDFSRLKFIKLFCSVM